jgi:ATP-binding cassette subfamily F protein uup
LVATAGKAQTQDARRQLADSGEVVRQTGVSVTRLSQDIPDDLAGTIFDVVAAGVGPAGTLLAQYHQASLRVAQTHDAAAMRTLVRLHQQLDAADAWQIHTRVETVLSTLRSNPDCRSRRHPVVGNGRRLARARWCGSPMCFLDEPNQPLDIDAVEWMEKLSSRGITLIRHPRSRLQHAWRRASSNSIAQAGGLGAPTTTRTERKGRALAGEATGTRGIRQETGQRRSLDSQAFRARRTQRRASAHSNRCGSSAPLGASAWARSACRSKRPSDRVDWWSRHVVSVSRVATGRSSVMPMSPSCAAIAWG